MPRASFQSTPRRDAQTIGYGQDLAFIHDEGFGQVARDAARLLVARLRPISHVRRPSVIDLGCGSGILARELVEAGCDVLGIDRSPAMLRIARRRAPGARFVRASVLDAKVPPCDAVAAIGEVFNYLFDPRSRTAVALWRVFHRVHDALRPGGIFVFDLAAPGRGGGLGKRQNNSEGKDWAILLETEEDAARSFLTRRIVSFRRAGKLYRRSEEVHRLRLYHPAEVKRMLRRAGFECTIARGYGSSRLPSSGWITVIATKPAITRAAATAARRSARSTRLRARSNSE
jgi:SAM-dependent methyltransferase